MTNNQVHSEVNASSKGSARFDEFLGRGDRGRLIRSIGGVAAERTKFSNEECFLFHKTTNGFRNRAMMSCDQAVT